MYADNGKISSRQIFRLFVFDLMGLTTLLLPSMLAEMCGADGVFSILIGTALGFIYLLYLGWIMKKMKTDMCSFLREEKSNFTRKVVLVLVLLHCLVTASFCANVFANLMQYSLIKEASFEVVLVVIVAAATYAISGGIEGRARVYEVLFWFVLLPYVAMMLFSLKNVEVEYVDAFFIASTADVLQGGYLVFLFLTPLFFSVFILGDCEKESKNNLVKTVSAAIVVSAILLLGGYVILLGNFGTEALASMDYPVITLMSTIQFRGNFVKRMDAFMVAVWFFTLFALFNLHLHYAIEILKETRGSKRRGVLLPGVLVFLLAYVLQNPETMDLFFRYYIYLAVPGMVVGPALLLWKRR